MKDSEINEDIKIRIAEIETLIISDRIDEAYELYKTSEIPNYHFYESLINFGVYSEILRYEYSSKEELVCSLLKRCHVLTYKDNYEEVLKVCEVIFELDEHNEIGLWYKTFSLYKVGKCEETLKLCDYAIKLYPNNWMFYETKAMIFDIMFNDFEAAAEYYDKSDVIRKNKQKSNR